jgi:hypothetical protein
VDKSKSWDYKHAYFSSTTGSTMNRVGETPWSPIAATRRNKFPQKSSRSPSQTIHQPQPRRREQTTIPIIRITGRGFAHVPEATIRDPFVPRANSRRDAIEPLQIPKSHGLPDGLNQGEGGEKGRWCSPFSCPEKEGEAAWSARGWRRIRLDQGLSRFHFLPLRPAWLVL